MSSQDPYADPFGGGEPSEEQMQAMMAQMRVMPVDQHIAQAMQLLLEGAQVKIGRNDGRLLLDSAQVLLSHVRPYADKQLVAQVDEAVAQLRMAQVQAEGQLQRAAMEDGHAESGDLPTPPRPPVLAEPLASDEADGPGDVAPAAPAPPPPAAGGPKLWTPGG